MAHKRLIIHLVALKIKFLNWIKIRIKKRLSKRSQINREKSSFEKSKKVWEKADRPKVAFDQNFEQKRPSLRKTRFLRIRFLKRSVFGMQDFLRVVQTQAILFLNQCRKESEPTYNDSAIEWWFSRSTPNRLKWLNSKFRVVLCRTRLFPTLFSTKMDLVWITLKN